MSVQRIVEDAPPIDLQAEAQHTSGEVEEPVRNHQRLVSVNLWSMWQTGLLVSLNTNSRIPLLGFTCFSERDPDPPSVLTSDLCVYDSHVTCWSLSRSTCPSPPTGRETALLLPWCPMKHDSETSRRSPSVLLFMAWSRLSDDITRATSCLCLTNWRPSQNLKHFWLVLERWNHKLASLVFSLVSCNLCDVIRVSFPKFARRPLLPQMTFQWMFAE